LAPSPNMAARLPLVERDSFAKTRDEAGLLTRFG
jgi:hypothetical protein